MIIVWHVSHVNEINLYSKINIINNIAMHAPVKFMLTCTREKKPLVPIGRGEGGLGSLWFTKTARGAQTNILFNHTSRKVGIQ